MDQGEQATGNASPAPLRVLTDCNGLKRYLSEDGHTLRTTFTVHGHNWNLRYRMPEEALCNELAAGSIENGGTATQRLNELRALDQFVLTAEQVATDAAAQALFSDVAREENFLQLIDGDTLPCVFAHREAIGSGPWPFKLILAFERDTMGTVREILVTNVPRIEGLTIRMPVQTKAINAARWATMNFLQPNPGS